MQLEVIQQKEVRFYEDELIAVRTADGQVYVAVSQMCQVLGVNERSQRRRIQNHRILSKGFAREDISAPLRPTVAAAADKRPVYYGLTWFPCG